MTQFQNIPENLDPRFPTDRQNIAEFVLARQAAIRRLARQKLGQSARTLFDSEVVFSSVARVLDECAARGTLDPANERELWGFIAAVTQNNAAYKTRLAARARALLDNAGPYLLDRLARAQTCDDESDAAALCAELMASLPSSDDRKLFALRLRGASHRVAGEALGIDEAACRQRWQGIRDRLVRNFRSAHSE